MEQTCGATFHNGRVAYGYLSFSFFIPSAKSMQHMIGEADSPLKIKKEG